MSDTQTPQAEVERGRCCQCGRVVELAALAEGFNGLGWCAECEREKRQPMFELAEAWPK